MNKYINKDLRLVIEWIRSKKIFLIFRSRHKNIPKRLNFHKKGQKI